MPLYPNTVLEGSKHARLAVLCMLVTSNEDVTELVEINCLDTVRRRRPGRKSALSYMHLRRTHDMVVHAPVLVTFCAETLPFSIHAVHASLLTICPQPLT